MADKDKMNKDKDMENTEDMDTDMPESGSRGGRTRDTGETSDLESDLGMEDFEDMGRDDAM